MDVLVLAQELLRCRSVTPADGGAQAVLAAALERLGFAVTKLRFGAIENFFAERPGTGNISASPAIPMWCRRAKAGGMTRSPAPCRTACSMGAARST